MAHKAALTWGRAAPCFKVKVLVNIKTRHSLGTGSCQDSGKSPDMTQSPGSGQHQGKGRTALSTTVPEVLLSRSKGWLNVKATHRAAPKTKDWNCMQLPTGSQASVQPVAMLARVKALVHILGVAMLSVVTFAHCAIR